MKRKLLMGLLATGALFGFLGGAHRLLHGAHGHHERYRARWKDQVAETCTRAAHEVWDRRSKDPP